MGKNNNKVEMSIAQPTETVKVGELFLTSQIKTVDELVGLALGMLKDKDVMDYLKNCEKRKLGSYYG